MYFKKIMNIYKSTDIFLISYPKSGTTWMQYILYLIFKDDENFSHIENVFPNIKNINKRPDSNLGLFKTHLKGSLFPNECKKIYISRNPYDVCVSYYFHIRQPKQKLDEFVNNFITGKILFGSYKEHIIDSLTLQNVLYLKYEDLINNFTSELEKILKFLNIELTNDEKNEIKNKTSFSEMKKKYKKLSPKRGDNSIFFREGKINNFRNYLNENQIELIKGYFYG